MSKEIRPDYYKSEDGKLEAFDVIDSFGLNFNLGNALKYIIRAGKKDDKEKDLRKAITYLEREINPNKKNNNLEDLEDVTRSNESKMLELNMLSDLQEKLMLNLKRTMEILNE